MVELLEYITEKPIPQTQARQTIDTYTEKMSSNRNT